MTERTGTVRSFNVFRGFGFITAAGEDVFLHVGQIADNVADIHPGTRVVFIAGEDRHGRGAYAKQVRVIA